MIEWLSIRLQGASLLMRCQGASRQRAMHLGHVTHRVSHDVIEAVTDLVLFIHCMMSFSASRRHSLSVMSVFDSGRNLANDLDKLVDLIVQMLECWAYLAMGPSRTCTSINLPSIRS